MNRNASGNVTNTAAPTNGPHKLPVLPMMTMEMMRMDSMTVKLVGSM